MTPATILLAEDTQEVRQLMVAVLRQNGYEVLDAPDGMSALEIAGRYRGLIDLLITDVNMPRLDGPGLCDRLRQMRPGIKALFVSGAAAKHKLDGAHDMAFLAKPFTAYHLLQSTQRLLALSPAAER